MSDEQRETAGRPEQPAADRAAARDRARRKLAAATERHDEAYWDALSARFGLTQRRSA